MKTVIDPPKDSSTSKTNWHRLLGSVLEQLLTPVGIAVYTDVPVMSDPPEADILLVDGELGDNTGVDGHIVDPVGVAWVK